MITHLQKWSLLALLAAGSLSAQEWKPSDWPVLKHYDKEHLFQIALPLGGIGTGTVSLGGRGELRDWEIMNVPGKKYSTVTTGNNAPFFSIYVKRLCQNADTAFFYAQSPDFLKPGLCYYPKFSYL